MLKLQQAIIQLYRKVSTSLPPDVEDALKTAHSSEAGNSETRILLEDILSGVKSSRSEKRPVCMETGIPVFYVSAPPGLSHREIETSIKEATREATRKIPLSPSAVDPITAENSGDNTGDGFPIIHFEESESTSLSIELVLKPS
ncbi:MAG: fumarate hydratase, partial [Gammaproteobacteria bacterium]|nr:fumarate hydratase [Gammaproteobacteria bacterium]NIW98101.1 fumarate hydratase [Phycisphaerae bacterium]